MGKGGSSEVGRKAQVCGFEAFPYGITMMVAKTKYQYALREGHTLIGVPWNDIMGTSERTCHDGHHVIAIMAIGVFA